MEDGDIVEVHMEQLGGGLFSKDEDWEDWVVVVSDEELFQQTLEEKARLYCLISRLKNEISALKANNRELMTNNRAFAKENNSLKTEKTELNVCLKPL
jgi:FtsZ-binding cell division protein ZapB